MPPSANGCRPATRYPAWQTGIEVVALEPSTPFAAALRWLLPQVRIVVDHLHLIAR